ncbi:MAG TPA: P1 family peptidase [Pseudonocardiaceae bacterium]|jgi:L-aminopeptidase/D-esterase-like protein|nr:P1 family peptidase [Pseudonocardiaceae bacterium]
MSDLRPGEHNAITDVPGVLVGHHQRIEDGWATGTTVVYVPDSAVGAVEVRGGAPGTRDTDLLEPSTLVQRVNAVCLTGGSAYGLAAVDGVMRWLAEHHQGLPVGMEPHEVVPIVPGAVIFDLPRGTWGNRPNADFGYAACEAATSGPVRQGCVGAGTGAKLGALKGGVGTASVVLSDPDGDIVVGALVVANAAGNAVDQATGRPYAAEFELADEFGVSWPDRPGAEPQADQAPLNTTIGVVAVNVDLTQAEARRLAMAGQNGLVHAVRPSHTMFDGDSVFALATGQRPLLAGTSSFADPGRAAQLDRCTAAATDVFARAMVHALLSAHGLPGLPAYRDLWPGVVN